MNVNEMFWFTLSETPRVVGFPCPKLMSVLELLGWKRKQRTRWSPCSVLKPGRTELPMGMGLVNH